MSDHPQRLSAHAREQATKWFIGFREGDDDEATRTAFYKWLRKSPENVQAYLRITALWEDAELLKGSEVFDRDHLLNRARAEDNVIPLSEPLREVSGTADGKPPESNVGEEKAGQEPALRAEAGAIEAHSDRMAANVQASPISSRELSAHSWRRKVRLFAAAAAIVLAVVGMWLYAQRGLYSTGVGEQRTVILADGSTIILNARSRMRVHLTKTERDIDLLEGQAIFRVAHDAGRPFVVHTAAANVRAIGTQFDVYRKRDATTVTVIEGRVAVRTSAQRKAADAGFDRERGAPDEKGARQSAQMGGTAASPSAPDGGLQTQEGEILLDAGQQITAMPLSVAAPRRANLETVTAWTQGELVFDETPISDVIEEFNRYSTRRLVVDDPQIRAFHVSGVFPSSEPTRIAELLRQRFGVSVRESDDEIRITRE